MRALFTAPNRYEDALKSLFAEGSPVKGFFVGLLRLPKPASSFVARYLSNTVLRIFLACESALYEACTTWEARLRKLYAPLYPILIIFPSGYFAGSRGTCSMQRTKERLLAQSFYDFLTGHQLFFPFFRFGEEAMSSDTLLGICRMQAPIGLAFTRVQGGSSPSIHPCHGLQCFDYVLR